MSSRSAFRVRSAVPSGVRRVCARTACCALLLAAATGCLGAEEPEPAGGPQAPPGTSTPTSTPTPTPTPSPSVAAESATPSAADGGSGRASGAPAWAHM